MDDFKTRYCAALRSATCPQHRGSYRGPDGGCCATAIAFDLVGVDPDGDDSAAHEKAGLTLLAWQRLCGMATTLSDDHSLSFSEIADVIEGKRPYPGDGL